MTKSNKTVAATVPAITLPSIVDLNLKVHSEQVIKIAVSEFEESCIAKRASTKEQLGLAAKAKDKAQQVLSEACKAQAEAALQPKAQAFASAFQAFSGLTKTRLSYGAKLITSDSGKVTDLQVVARVDALDSNDRVDIQIGGAEEKVTANEAVRKADEVYTDCSNDVRELTTLLQKLDEALRDLPRMQRRAEAALATKVVSDVEGGAALVESLRGAVFTGEITKLLA